MGGGTEASVHGVHTPAGTGTQSFHSALTGAQESLQEAHLRLAGAHQREIDAFQREVETQKRELQQLREKVAQLSQFAKAAEAAALCARIDDPDMQDVAAQVAVNISALESKEANTTAIPAVAAAAAAAAPGGKTHAAVTLPPAPTAASASFAPTPALATPATAPVAAAATSSHEAKGASGPGPDFEEQQLSKGGSSTNAEGRFSQRSSHDTPSHERLSRKLSEVILSSQEKKQKRPSIWGRLFGVQNGNPVERLMDPLGQKNRRAEEIRKELEKYQTPAEKRLRKAQGNSAQHIKHKGISLANIVDHPGFDSLCAVIIILNSFLVGYDVQWKTTHQSSELWVELASYFCNLFFVVELIVRLAAVGWREFFCGDSQLWSIFDTLLVLVSIVDLFMGFGGSNKETSNVSSGVKTVKMFRIAKVFRVFRFFKELSLLALMILDSMKSLMWALLMLSIILYVFAILFTQSASDYIQEDPHAPGVAELQRQFGDIPRTLYSLLQAMLGGVSWGVASDSLFNIHWSTTGLFFFYIFFTILAFLNVTTGVFVDNAVETARTQRDFLVQKETEIKEKYLAEMRSLFADMDEDGSGTVSLEEVSTYFEDPRVQSYFAALGLDSADAERLFSLLDTDLDGDVSIDEFLEGCLRLKGFARSIDVHHLLMEFKKFNKTATMNVNKERSCKA